LNREDLFILAFKAFYYIRSGNYCLLSSVVEQLTRNEQVVGSTPMGGSGKIADYRFFDIFATETRNWLK
jgi:hypothetical protein